MKIVAQVTKAVQSMLIAAAEAADATLGYTKRPDRAKFSASTLVQTLVFGWLAHPDASVEQLAQSAARVGVEVSPQAIDQRFTPETATLLQTVLQNSTEQLIASEPVAIPILQRFNGVYVHDCTTISLPEALTDTWRGCAGDGSTAALKCGVQLDLLRGSLQTLDLTDGRANDQTLPMQQAALPKGALRLADLGFYDLKLLARLSEEGVYWLTKVRVGTLLGDESSAVMGLLAFVKRLGDVRQWEGWVWVGGKGQLRARLMVERVPQEVADQRRRRLRKEAQDKGRSPSEEALALAAWTLLLTNVPEAMLSVKEALVVAKVRWQIELVFKLWKSHGKLASWRTEKPARILCEVYGKLLAMLLQHWVLVLGCWSYPERSLVKAAQVVRDHAVVLACVCRDAVRLSEALEVVQCVLKSTARMNTRHTKPNTYQLLLALTTQPEEA